VPFRCVDTYRDTFSSQSIENNTFVSEVPEGLSVFGHECVLFLYCDRPCVTVRVTRVLFLQVLDLESRRWSPWSLWRHPCE